MDKLIAWTPARLYRTPSGPQMGWLFGPFENKSNAVCPHAQPTPECPCGFTTFAGRGAAQEEAYGMALLEVEHDRTRIWTDGRVIRSLTQDVRTVFISSECYECSRPAVGVTQVPCNSTDFVLEPSCESCASATGITPIDALSLELECPVSWNPDGGMAAYTALNEAEEILGQAMMNKHVEVVLETLDNAEHRREMFSALTNGGPEAFVGFVLGLCMVPYDEVEKRSGIIKQMLAFNDGEIERQFIDAVAPEAAQIKAERHIALIKTMIAK